MKIYSSYKIIKKKTLMTLLRKMNKTHSVSLCVCVNYFILLFTDFDMKML